jgi:CRP/FNR family transcriptional regulator
LEALRKIGLLSGFSDDQLKRLKEISVVMRYEKGEVIFDPSRRAEGFYILKRGRVKVYRMAKGKEQIIGIFSEPAFFGEAASFMGSNFPAWAEALESSEVAYIPRRAFINAMREDPEIGMKLMAVMAQRLFHLAGVIESLSLKDALSKVADYILRKCKGGVVDFRTNLVAMELGLTKETVSRMLNKLKSLGIIEKSGSKVRVVKAESLKDLSA